MVSDPGQPLEDRGNPRQRPEIGGKPLGQGPLAESRIELGQLLCGQPWLAPQAAGGLESCLALGVPRLEPPMRRNRCHPEGSGDRGLGLATGKPPRRLEAAALPTPRSGFVWAWLNMTSYAANPLTYSARVTRFGP